ncbi:alpha/beta hydrolase [Nostoc sp. CHAB 5844]|nr:alpha/beta hydrolase [Nostoc sp. CHAB 5844]
MKIHLLSKQRFIYSTALLSLTFGISCGQIQTPIPKPMPSTQTQSSLQSSIQRQDTFVTSEPSIQIFVREVKTLNTTRRPVLLLHGGGGGGVASFDIDVPGYSVAADLAQAGHPVYVMNVRGWEQSTRPDKLSQPSNVNPPLVTSREALRDIDAVIDHIRDRNANQPVALIGWATGGHWAGMYTSRHNDKVSHLVMLNSLYGVNAPWEYRSTLENPQRLGEFDRSNAAYREVTAEGLIANWTRAIPLPDKTQWRDPAVVQAYQRMTLESDPTSSTRQPSSVRLPGAFRLEAYNLSKGQQYWDGADIRVPTLYIRGDRDHWSRPQDLTALKSDLVNAPRVETVTIANATHFLFLDRPERGRRQFLQAVTAFLQ